MSAEELVGSFFILSMCYFGFAVTLYIIMSRKNDE